MSLFLDEFLFQIYEVLADSEFKSLIKFPYCHYSIKHDHL